MSCPKSKRGHRWGGSATIDNAMPASGTHNGNPIVATRECVACGAPGVVTTQGRTIAK